MLPFSAHRRTRATSRLASATAALAALPLCGLHAQTSISAPARFEPFGARNESNSGTTFTGLSLTGYSGLLGLRVSGAVAGLGMGTDGRRSVVPMRSCSRFGCRTYYANQYSNGDLFNVDAWNADADAIIEPFRTAPVLRQLVLGFSPYAFIGIGTTKTNTGSLSGTDTSTRIWSYGVGVRHDLVSRLGVTAEVRARRSLSDNAFLYGSQQNSLQYRIGIGVGLGGGKKKPSPDPVIVSRRPMGGGTPAAVPAPVVTAPAPAASVAADEAAVAAMIPRLLDAADALVNTRWLDGGTSPETGFDAGGFVQHVFASEGVRLPRLVRDLAVTGTSVSVRIGTLRAGDLLFFSNDGVTPDHVAIYVGRDKFVHASASGGGVRYDVLGEGARGAWFAEHLLSARRIVTGREGSDRAPAPMLAPSGRPDRAPRPAGGL